MLLTDALSSLPASWVQLGAAGILGLGVIALITGRGLATRREVDAADKRVEEANRRADRWEQVALEALQQNRRLITTAEAGQDVLRALPAALESEPDRKESRTDQEQP